MRFTPSTQSTLQIEHTQFKHSLNQVLYVKGALREVHKTLHIITFKQVVFRVWYLEVII